MTMEVFSGSSTTSSGSGKATEDEITGSSAHESRSRKVVLDRDRQMTRSQLRIIIFEYVEVFYNRERHQAVLGHLTPAEYYATAQVA